MVPCDDRALEALLNTDDEPDLLENDLADAAAHVETCEPCQNRLTQLAAEEGQWEQVQMALAPECLSTDIYAESRRPRTSKRSETWTQAMAQSLLSPARHPEMLGRLGRYEVERLIGSGGMGIVLKAHDTELHRPVAIKLLAPYLAENTAARERFAREAKAAAAVVDDHVVPIHNVETDGSQTPFLVMQYIAGGSLQERIDHGGPLEVAEILRIALHTAQGLSAAHAQGLIHRDVKPSNILLDETVERALLTDFGLARAEGDACVTRSGFQPGTPHYMSPEQVRGESIDPRSDLFGLGCVMYALCTGHPPFRSESGFAVLRRITEEKPQPLRELNPSVPEWLEQIVMKLLEKSPANRFASADEVVQLLRACLSHVQDPPNNPLPKTPGESGRSRSARSGASQYLIAGILSLAVGLGLAFAGILVVLELNKGTLTIESAVPDVPIRIRKADREYATLTVTTKPRSIRVAAGRYIVEIIGQYEGLTIENRQVVVTRGMTHRIRIVHSPKPSETPAGRKPILSGIVDTRLLLPSKPIDATADSLRFGNLSVHVDQFNRLCAKHPVGKSQPKLTVDEMLSSIQWLLATDPNREQKDFAPQLKRIARSQFLPDGWTLRGQVKDIHSADGAPLARAWEISLCDARNGMKVAHVVRLRYLTPLVDLKKPSAAGIASDPDGTPLAAALRALNNSSRLTVDGTRQPPLTIDEVLGAILAWQSRRDEALVVNKDFAAFQKIAETRVLPKGAAFEAMGGFAEDGRVYYISSLRIRMPKSSPKGSSFAFEIRNQFVRSRPETERDRSNRRKLLGLVTRQTPRPDQLLGTWQQISAEDTPNTMKIARTADGKGLELHFTDVGGRLQRGRLSVPTTQPGRFAVVIEEKGRVVRTWFGKCMLEGKLLRWEFTAGNFTGGRPAPPSGDWSEILKRDFSPRSHGGTYRKVP